MKLGKIRATDAKPEGFTLVEIMIVVAIIGMLASIAVPYFVRARTTSQKNACINNLRQIDGAKQEWALETRSSNTATPTIAQIQPYLGRGSGGTQPTCPADGQSTFDTSYVMADVQSTTACLISPTTHIIGGAADISGGKSQHWRFGGTAGGGGAPSGSGNGNGNGGNGNGNGNGNGTNNGNSGPGGG